MYACMHACMHHGELHILALEKGFGLAKHTCYCSMLRKCESARILEEFKGACVMRVGKGEKVL